MMNLRKYTLLGRILAVTLGGQMAMVAQPGDDQSGAEVMTRGPVHEAFAGTVSYDPEAGIIVDQAPPALIEEVPPEQRLEGDNVSWIPGYWAWDEDQNDFLWVSGIWRNLPPGREWVPGYWAETGGRYQWTSGYWEDAQNTEVSYLPEPPRSVESGPNIEAASNDQTWVPGNWMWRDDRYAWRAGSWVDARENWSWTPAYYRWTPRGYVYVDGYWDYPVERRGVVFAPVHFERSYVSRPDFHYSPLTVISLSVFTNHLFLRPNYGHYYFGDYYEPRYRDRGYFASYSYNSGRRGYDPIYAHNRWENRNDRNWDQQRREYFEYRRDHQDSRPPRTWAALKGRPEADRQRGDFGVADRFDRVVGERGEGRQRFQKVDKQERDRFVSQRQEIRKFGREREQLETSGKVPSKKGDQQAAVASRVKVGRSPVIAKKSDRSDKDGGPPARLQPRDSDQAGNPPKGQRDGQGKPNVEGDRGGPGKTNKDGTANREGKPRPNENQKDPQAPERRTKPGQKREPDSVQQGKGKPDVKPKTDPQPQPQKKADPTPAPAPKRQADPTPERKAKSDPSPARKTQPDSDRKVQPQPERKATPAPTPAPKKQADPNPERKKKAEPDRDSASSSGRKPQAQPQPQRKEEARSAKPQPAAPQPRQVKQPKPQAAPAGADSSKSKDGEGKRKKKDD